MAKVDNKSTAPITPGAILSKARKKAKVTQKAVAKRLFVRQQVVESIENDDYNPSLSQTFWRGYIRAYGKFLDVSEKELSAACEKVLGPVNEQALTGLVRPTKSAGIDFDPPKKSNKWIGFILFPIILIGLFFLYTEHQSSKTTTVTTPEPETVNKAKKNKASSKNSSQQVIKSIPIPTIKKPLSEKTTTELPPKAQKTLKKNTTTTRVPSQTQKQLSPIKRPKRIRKPTTPIPENTEPTLTIKAKQNTWINIRNESGKVIFSGPVIANQTKTVKYPYPFWVFMSTTKGIELSLNQKNIDLSKYKELESVEIKIDASKETE